MSYYLHKILDEASRYALLSDIYKADPALGPRTVAKMRECFRTDRGPVGGLSDIPQFMASNKPRA